jgi:hypothetical protein
MAFIPGTTDFALACFGTNSVRFYSATGAGGASAIPEFRDCTGATQVAFTADGSRGVFSCGGTVQFYDTLSASKITELTGFGSVLSIGLTLDGTRAYFGTTQGGANGSLAIVNMETYEVIRGVPVDSQPVGILIEELRDRVYVMGAETPRVFRMNREGVVDRIRPLNFKPLGGFFVPHGQL